MVQLSYPYMTTGKTISLITWTFVSKVLSLLFYMLSRFVIAVLPRSKHFLISRLQSPSAMILEPKKIKPATVSTFSPSICLEVMGPDALILLFWLLSFKSAFSISSFTFIKRLFPFSSVQFLSHVWLFATPWITARQASLSITNSPSSLRLKSIESVMPSSHLILYRPFSSCPQSLPA